MRFSAIQGIALALVGLAKAQCIYDLFEDLPNAPALGHNFPFRRARCIFAVAPNSPTTNPAVISAPAGLSFTPEFIFAGIFLRNLLGGATALSSASTITVTANFSDSTTAQTTFNIDPPDTVFGLSVGAQALQYFKFPCVWTGVVSLSFSPQAELGVDTGLGLAIDNFQYTVPLERV
ncbi:hypothetical protein J7T55_010301 [Diaporthe amygdali]|uniref:uncharacterized protein n=1 Tax=Phomopsis amygdali TaxID=1214568 RepID=UPI0022FEC130|nr:uncharacterized protein J7T55_010301 [Diaporthe amygdali]KAJ0107695.1 hypothetical protein J7T55_010301 [Diaporthe amygdali]